MLNYSEASHSKQVGVGLTDALLCLAIVAVFSTTRQPEVLYNYLDDINGSLLVLIVFVVYRLISLLFFGQTLGMLVFQLKLLNGEEQPLTFFEKILAAFFILYRGTAYYQVKSS